jgi:hypothetical protein
MTIKILYIIHHPVFYFKNIFRRLDPVSVYKVEPTQLDLIDRATLFLWTPIDGDGIQS